MTATTVTTGLSRKAQLIEEIFTGNYGFLRSEKGLLRLHVSRFRGKEAEAAIKWGVHEGWLTTEPYERKWYWYPGEKVYELHQPTPFFLPPDLLWELLEPAIAQCSGYSTITKAKEWLKLGIEPRDSKYHTADHITLMEEALSKLAQYGYIWFLQSGTIWEITKKDRQNVV